MRFYDVEATGRANRLLTETSLFQQKAILPFCPLASTRPTKHVQIAHCMRLIVFVLCGLLRHYALDQQ